ncbi:selenide, water dikinase SelD [Paraburkholderia tropica]|uniref:selenide, water dikinase SelD n=1 Tax=Paraburkholderia tropica TaxID=92647 RepID=UPI002AB71227|nr:selenide, water dikinase SelD [Paraburkholderia tropica]
MAASIAEENPASPRLTALSHGGGCGCKISPGILSDLLKRVTPKHYPDLLVGLEVPDDAAVFRLNNQQAVVATTDFFMPIVDDPFDFGRIAATNALSDIYAMGGTPLFALAILGMPVNVLSRATIARVLEGGESVCLQAGLPVAGGHSIDSVEPIYGLAAIGVVHPDRVLRKGGARSGDVIVLGKPLGIGVLSAAFKKGMLDPDGYAALIGVTTQLNRAGTALASLNGVHAMTDVTGFGLLGHLLELCRSSDVGARIDYSSLPWIPGVRELAEAGCVTGASSRNWDAYGQQVSLGAGLLPNAKVLLTDPQTSGGLIVACEQEAADRVLACLAAGGNDCARVIGTLVDGAPCVEVAWVSHG